MMSARKQIYCLALLGMGLLRIDNVVGNDRSADYFRDIKPLLREKCGACHGAWKQEGGLRLDTVAAMRHGGESGSAISASKPDSSLLLQRITSSVESERMPLQGVPLNAEQIEKLRTWINNGATGPTEEQPDRDPRQHWAFRTPIRPALPVTQSSSASRNPIDRFVAAEHEKRNLRALPAAEKATLLRRVYLDLVGLPPAPAELDDFLANISPNAYEQMVDRLLASPKYGERWGRHWMDVWRYADWYGRRHVPDVWNSAPQIWRWRDWIVRSLNRDKGYDRMLAEMLAADEIAPTAGDDVVATGYLIRNWYALNPNDWMRQNVEHTAKAFLGLTFNCAHCHDHKYDPISQRDYFAFRAFFEPIGIRQDRVAGEADPGPFQEYSYSVLRKIVRTGAVRVYDKTPEAPTWFYTGGDERNRVTEAGSIKPGLPAIFGDSLKIQPIEFTSPAAYYPGLQSDIQATVLRERRAAVEQRRQELESAKKHADAALPQLRCNFEKDFENNLIRRALEAEEHSVYVSEANLAAANAELASAECRIAADRAKYGETPGADIRALTIAAHDAERLAAVQHAEASRAEAERQLAAAEAKEFTDPERAKLTAAANKLLGEALTKLGQANAARADTAKTGEYTSFSPLFPARSTGRRQALAHWMGSDQNPLTARVAINHVWSRHFHAPLVSTVFDFGLNGSPPSHPELLDWLAVEFMESGWSMMHIHRLIVTSESYRMSSSTKDAEENQRLDAENRFLWRQNVGRMEAEVVRDSVLACQNHLNLTIGGQELENTQALTTHRRSLYYSCQPELDGKSEFGAIFDAPDALECYRRTRSIVPQQALALSNSAFVHQASAAIADQIWSTLPSAERADSVNYLVAAFKTILNRRPLDSEVAACQAFLAAQQQKRGIVFSEDAIARASLVRVLLNHNDFVTIR